MIDGALFGWDLAIWTTAGGATLAASIVRGFTGFGFALIMLGAMLQIADPQTVVPLTILLDLLAGFGLMRRALPEAHWSGIWRLLVGAMVGLPLGFACLKLLPADTMKLAIYCAILGFVLLLARGFRLSAEPGPRMLLGTGAIAGAMSGAAGIPGPPVVLLYLSSPLPVATARATAISFFLFVDTTTLAFSAGGGLLDLAMLGRAAVLAPVMIGGILVGQRLYLVAKPETVRRAAIGLLALLAIVGIARLLLG